MIRKIHTEIPQRNYASLAAAQRAFEKACGCNSEADLRFAIAADYDANNRLRFFPIFMPRADEIQTGIAFAQAGFLVVGL